MPVEVTISSLMTTITEVFTAVISMVSSVGTAVVNNPLLLLYALIPLSMIAIGVFKRLLNVN